MEKLWSIRLNDMCGRFHSLYIFLCAATRSLSALILACVVGGQTVCGFNNFLRLAHNVTVRSMNERTSKQTFTEINEFEW